MNKILKLIICIVILMISGCRSENTNPEDTLIFETGSYPYLTKEGDTYYYLMPSSPSGRIAIYSASTPEGIKDAEPVTVWKSPYNEYKNIWSPELHRIDNKWYIYFEADDGNTDNHHLYVLENDSADPTKGLWQLKGPIMINEEWNYGIHPSVFTVRDKKYLIWSGWEKRRTETETQCIFIAEMENPWTLKSDRVMISKPVYEWERQWINPDGSRSAYPIFVNENPEGFVSPNGKKVVILYSASGIWTAYAVVGMLKADASSNLLDPKSWHKVSEPVFTPVEDGNFIGASNITIAPNKDNSGSVLMYQAKHKDATNDNSIMLRNIKWEGDSALILGKY